eukprot:TRINITY_DN8643_c0_g1_i3.p1 TRINITY_DN8643_c0_g1~~TRINITY_DN8643_c0_g1_i3.p1  ORF type:complete len:306 (+),score=68.95 TRINITY_DN8643_c0_g1_i3:209-1126(+)
MRAPSKNSSARGEPAAAAASWHNKVFSSRKAWGTNNNARRSTADSGSVPTTMWAVRQAQKMNHVKFWKQEDAKIIAANKLASWGGKPAFHPGTKDNKPRSWLQKWCSRGQQNRSTRLHDPTFDSDEPIAGVLQSSSLSYHRRPNDMLRLDSARSTSTRRPASALPTRGPSITAPIPRASSSQGDRSATKPAPKVEAEARPLSEYSAMTHAVAGMSRHVLVNPKTNPPLWHDAMQDRARGRQLQSAKADWRDAEMLLALGASADKVAACFANSSNTLKCVADTQQPEAAYDVDAPFERSRSCSRFV